MSRSRRSTPVTGLCADSDKAFKVTEHRRARRASHALDLIEAEPPHRRAFGNPWASQKDGKTRFDPGAFPELMRK